MLPNLQQGFAQIEEQRLGLKDRLSVLTDSQWDWRAGPDSWSIRQIVEHLALGDETVGKTYPAGSVPLEPWAYRLIPRAMRRGFAIRALEQGRTLPLPSEDLNPSGQIAVSELFSRWEAIRAGLRRDLEGFSQDEARFAHPILGPMTASQMLALGRAHTDYHTRQIESLLRHPDFPNLPS